MTDIASHLLNADALAEYRSLILSPVRVLINEDGVAVCDEAHAHYWVVYGDFEDGRDPDTLVQGPLPMAVTMLYIFWKKSGLFIGYKSKLVDALENGPFGLMRSMKDAADEMSMEVSEHENIIMDISEMIMRPSTAFAP